MRVQLGYNIGIVEVAITEAQQTILTVSGTTLDDTAWREVYEGFVVPCRSTSPNLRLINILTMSGRSV